MYKTLWNGMNKQMGKSHASALFLAVLLIGWTAAGFMAGSVVCLVGGMSTITRITVLLCSAGYSGLIFGFFGGILYLYRTGSRHSTTVSAPSTASSVSRQADIRNPLRYWLITK